MKKICIFKSILNLGASLAPVGFSAFIWRRDPENGEKPQSCSPQGWWEYQPWLMAACLVLLASGSSLAQTIWTGPKMVFTKPDFSDYTLEENQDRITPNVWITRQNTQGIYNIKQEDFYEQNFSPQDTEWAFGTTADMANLTFANWQTTVNSRPPSMVDRDMVVHLISEDIYIDIKFTNWAVRSGGGGFSYIRSTKSPDTPAPALLSLEAECAQVGGGWTTVKNEAAASGASYVVFNNGVAYAPPADVAANQVRFSFNLNAPGAYYLFARIRALSSSDDSFWVRINNGPWFSWSGGIAINNHFNWNRYPANPLNLPAGANTLDFAYREDGTQLDKIILNTQNQIPVGLGQPSGNCQATAASEQTETTSLSLKLYPNEVVNGQLTVVPGFGKQSEKQGTLLITDLLGNVLASLPVTEGTEATLDMSKFGSRRVLIVSLVGTNGEAIRKRVIVR
ncbi:MAG: hypothetical protein HC880_07810 [Bacteroidia bacterium]|nr:hypothetical protein [Bacteroidia bacterium]